VSEASDPSSGAINQAERSIKRSDQSSESNRIHRTEEGERRNKKAIVFFCQKKIYSPHPPMRLAPSVVRRGNCNTPKFWLIKKIIFPAPPSNEYSSESSNEYSSESSNEYSSESSNEHYATHNPMRLAPSVVRRGTFAK
jgi:hypothetical protein